MTQGSEPSLPTSVTRKGAARGLAFTGIAQIVRIGLGFVANVVLARLLLPEDFGLVAMVAPAANFATLMQDLGFSQVVIQRERITPRQLSALFWTSCLLSLVLASLLALGAPALAAFYGEPRARDLTNAFACVTLVASLQAIPGALLSRNLRFGTLAVIDTVATTVGFAAGVAYAIVSPSYWALFVVPLATAMVATAAKLALAGWLPGRSSFEGEARSLIGFGSGVSGFNLVNFVAHNADTVLIARVWGTSAVGLYDRAYKLLLVTTLQVSVPVGRVMTPMLSRLQGDHLRYRKAFADCITMLMLVLQPGILVAVLFAEEVFTLLLGQQWAAAAPIFAWLGLASLHRVFTSSLGWLYLSQGRAKHYLIGGIWGSTTTIASSLIGLLWGPVGVAVAFTISDYLMRLPFGWFLAGREGPIRLRDLIAIALPHAVAVLATVAVLLGIGSVTAGWGPVRVLLLGAAAYLGYLLVLVLFASKRAVLASAWRTARGMT